MNQMSKKSGQITHLNVKDDKSRTNGVSKDEVTPENRRKTQRFEEKKFFTC